MRSIKDIQTAIKTKQMACSEAGKAYYEALQKLSLQKKGSIDHSLETPTEAEVESLRKASLSARQVLQAELSRLAEAGTPQQLIGQTSANIPYLLLPVRVEARYITFRHVLRPLPPEHIIDLGSGSIGAESWRFQKDDDGRMTYFVPSFTHISRSYLKKELEKGVLKPPSGKFIKSKADRRELWIRIYPDDISLETHERYLLPAEWEMGKTFWQNIWKKADPETAWLELSAMASPPRAAWIVRSTRPINYEPGDELPPVPDFPHPELKDGVYTLPPVARLLPERFVVRLYKNGQFKEFVGNLRTEPLLTGIDPTDDPFNTADDEEGSKFSPEGTALKAPEYMRWMFDLEAAEKAGMAIRIDLNQHPEYDQGVDQIVVLGASLGMDVDESVRSLNSHLENHLFKEFGLSILPQGTPTNNSGAQKSGFNLREEEAKAYFQSEWFEPNPTQSQTDETVLLQSLGMHPSFRLPNGHLMDIGEASLMNNLLWPATWGYFLLQFFTPQLNESKRESLRKFFADHVSGRGVIPALRINNQPYGIVPVTSFKHLAYSRSSDEEKFLAGIWTQFLSKLDGLWKGMTENILSVSNTQTSGQRLDESFLHMLGLSASSVNWNRQWLVGDDFQEMMKTPVLNARLRIESDPRFNPLNLRSALKSAGFDDASFKEITDSYASYSEQLHVALIDSLPVAENRIMEQMPGKAWNYLQWLASSKCLEIWNNSFASAPAGDGHPESKSATSLFARLVRQATLRLYLETGLRLAEPNLALWLLKVKDFALDHVNSATIRITNPRNLGNQNKIHLQYKPIIDHFKISTPFELEPDRRQYFNKKYPGTGQLSLADWLDQSPAPESQAIRNHKAALSYFSQLPSARLERLFSEHLDLCSHRLDAWMTGLVSQRLQKQRQTTPKGIHLGAFGYLLNLKPSTQRAVVVVETEPELMPATLENIDKAAIPMATFTTAMTMGIDPRQPNDQTFFYLGLEENPGLRLQTAMKRVEPDPTQNNVESKGFRHLPSLAHASAAAILQAGYLSHKVDNTAQTMAINLNASRVRQAMKLLEGMQQGASLAELLGFHFERLLHDRGLDRFLLDIRKKYPLQRTSNENEAISPLTTTDGLRLLSSWRANNTTWLNGVSGASGQIEKNAINAVVKEIDDHFDALGDLLLSESVYQTVKGNPDRAAAALRTLNSGGQPVTPEFIHPQPQGRTITHRVGVVFEKNSIGAEKVWSQNGTPRSQLSPALNQWLSKQLPLPDRIKITITPENGSSWFLDLTDLDLEPVDLIYAFPASLQDAENSSLMWLIQQKAIEKSGLPADQIQISLESREGLSVDDLTLFEVSSLLTALQKIATTSRPIVSKDFLLPDQALTTAEDTIDPSALRTIVQQLLHDQGQLEKTILALRSQDSPGFLSAFQQAWLLGQEDARLDNAEFLAEKGERLATDLEARLKTMRSLHATISPNMSGAELFQILHNICETLYGKQLRVLPLIIPGDIQSAKAAYEGRSSLENASPDTLDEWLREAALVRSPLQAFRQMTLLREVLQSPDSVNIPLVMQFPFQPGKQRWIGGQLAPEGEEAKLEDLPSLSLFLEMPKTYQFEGPLIGFMLDEWPEFIPFIQTDTGITFQYNQPNTEPPQAMLLAVSPVEGGNWTWEYLMGAVMDALEMSKKRLITPTEIETKNPALAHVLPAITLPFMQGNQNVPVVSLPI